MNHELEDLRAELDKLTTPPSGAGLTWLDEQIVAIAALQASHDHNITVFERASEVVNGNGWVNCFMYALDIDPISVNDIGADRFPNSMFVAHVVGKGLLVQKDVTLRKSADGDIAIYFDINKQPTHAAKKKGDLFISKWGGRGVLAHIWEHRLFEVPSKYGNEVRVYGSIPQEAAIQAFEEWARP